MIDMFSLTRGIPEHYNNFLASTDKLLARSNRFVVRRQALEKTSKKNYQNVPSNATIRSEEIKCGKSSCPMCPHGPYYYAYWKDDYGKLRKKYIGTKYDESTLRVLEDVYDMR